MSSQNEMNALLDNALEHVIVQIDAWRRACTLEQPYQLHWVLWGYHCARTLQLMGTNANRNNQSALQKAWQSYNLGERSPI